MQATRIRVAGRGGNHVYTKKRTPKHRANSRALQIAHTLLEHPELNHSQIARLLCCAPQQVHTVSKANDLWNNIKHNGALAARILVLLRDQPWLRQVDIARLTGASPQHVSQIARDSGLWKTDAQHEAETAAKLAQITEDSNPEEWIFALDA